MNIKDNIDKLDFNNNVFDQSFNDGVLGGCNIYGDPGTECPVLWKFLVDAFDIKSVIDIGCGFGYHLKYFNDVLKLDSTGIEGSLKVQQASFFPDKIMNWDFTKGIPIIGRTFDFGWSIEFLEHVDSAYEDNFLNILAKCKYIVVTHATIGQAGHNHVNCNTSQYWIDKFKDFNLIYDDKMTNIIRQLAIIDADEYIQWKKESPETRGFRGFAADTNPRDNYTPYVAINGLFFKNINLS